MRTQGFTLAEMLVVLLLMAVLAAIAMPQLSTQEPDRLDAATAEVRSALRFARHQAMQRGTAVLVDMETQTNTLQVRLGRCNNPGSLLTDPRSANPFILDLATRPATQQVDLRAQILVNGGHSYQSLVFEASGAISEACDMARQQDKGPPQTGSQIVLSIGPHQQTLVLWPSTGRVSGP